MSPPTLARRGLTALAAASIVLLLLAVGGAWLLQAGTLRGPVVRLVERSMGRDIRVGGTLHITVFAAHPTITADRLTIGNPPWMPPGTTADIERFFVVLTWPGIRRPLGIDRVELHGCSLYLKRNTDGHANWQWTDPDASDHQQWPIVRNLSVPEARVRLDDERRHLDFDGTMSAQDVQTLTAPRTFEITGSGKLNGRMATIAISGDGLDVASHSQPYHFRLSARSSGSTLNVRGSLPRPFDFRDIDAGFQASGDDLNDLYFLTGVSLTNTASYKGSGQFVLRDARSEIHALNLTFGSTDIHGDIAIDSSSGRATMVAALGSGRLKLADFGLRAAGREPPGDDPPRLLLSTAAVHPQTLRRMDSTVRIQAERLDIGPVPLHSFAATLAVNHGSVTVNDAAAEMLGGRATGQLRVDATRDPMSAGVELRLDGVRLEQLAGDPGNPPIVGPLSVHAVLTGAGNSLHQAAAVANGTVTMSLPSGSIRSALAEAAGLDLRGLGLLLRKSSEQAPIRCGVASFSATDGNFVARRLMLDTDAALITGAGSIVMASESLDLEVHGKPKQVRILRLDAPLAVRGTLLHPTVSIDAGRAGRHLVERGVSDAAGCDASSAVAMHTAEREHNPP